MKKSATFFKYLTFSGVVNLSNLFPLYVPYNCMCHSIHPSENSTNRLRFTLLSIISVDVSGNIELTSTGSKSHLRR